MASSISSTSRSRADGRARARAIPGRDGAVDAGGDADQDEHHRPDAAIPRSYLTADGGGRGDRAGLAPWTLAQLAPTSPLAAPL